MALHKSRHHKADRIVLGAVVLAGLILAVCLLVFSRTGSQVQVRVSGEVVATFPLNRDTSYTIQGADGGTNQLEIQDGSAWVSQASCPDKLCMGMGKISKSGQSIVCLPNQVVVEVVSGKEDSGVDAKVG